MKHFLLQLDQAAHGQRHPYISKKTSLGCQSYQGPYLQAQTLLC